MRFLISYYKSIVSRVSYGFTLVELMVTIGIFVFMTSVILSKYNSFGAGTILSNMAYDIALTIRQAQVYGVGVKSAGNNLFSSAFGVHFDIGNTGDNTKFILFADKDLNGVYNKSSGDEDISVYSLKHGAKINIICADMRNETKCKEQTGNGNNKNSLDITFKRPDPRAIICEDKLSNKCENMYAQIIISSADGVHIKKVSVTQAGQISVDIKQ